MSKKAKIELIIKIVLILVFVPVGVVSWAWSETTKGNPFVGNFFKYNIHFGSFGTSTYNPKNSTDPITDNMQNAFDNILMGENDGDDIEAAYWKFGRIFKVVHERLGYNYDAITTRTYDGTNTTTVKNQEPASPGYWYGQVQLGTNADGTPIMSPNFSNAAKQIENKELKDNKTEYASIISEFRIEDRDGTDIDLANTFLTKGDTNLYNVAYMLSFFNRDPLAYNGLGIGVDNGETHDWADYRYDTAQRALLWIAGNPNFADPNIVETWPWHKEAYKLRLANDSYASYASIRNAHPMNAVEVSAEKSKIHTYLTSSDSKNYIVVGPFHMSDHMYASEADGREAITYFSGKGMENSNCLGGLIDCTITVMHSDKSTTTKKSKNMDWKVSGEKNFSICYGSIEDGNFKESSAQNTNYTAVNPGELKIPEQYTNNEVPYPNQDFYIKINADNVESGDYLSNLQFTVRDTQAIGNGKRFKYTMKERRLSLKKKSGDYQCDQCGQTFTQEEFDNSLNCEEEGGNKYHNCLIWKDEGIADSGQNFVYVQKTIKGSDGNWHNAKDSERNFITYRAITSSHGLYEIIKEHLENKPNNKCDDCKAEYIHTGGNDGKYVIGIPMNKDGKIGNDGFLRVYRGHYTGGPRNRKYISNNAETWYIDTNKLSQCIPGIEHYHTPDCYAYENRKA